MSRNYEKVDKFYNSNLWSKKMVFNAVNRWITEEEYRKITGEKYETISEESING